MSNLTIRYVVATSILFAGMVVSQGIFAGWGQYRGFTASELDEQRVADLKATGANLVRLAFNKKPLMYKKPPYKLNLKSFARLDRAIDLCEKYGLKIVINPATTPGMLKRNTSSPRDPFWSSYEWHDKLIALWDAISRRYAKRGDVIAGYELINEPSVPRTPEGVPKSGPADYNELVGKLVATIRRNDPERPIIVQVIPGRRHRSHRVYPLDGPQYLELPDDPNLVISFHMYEPHAFTKQGLRIWPDGVKYPGKAGAYHWNRKKLHEVMQPLRDLQKRYGYPIYVGEFSAVRWSGDAGNRYLKDVIDLFERYGWSWTYQKFRGAQVWDAEMSNYDRSKQSRQESTPRMELLKRYFTRNSCLGTHKECLKIQVGHLL